MEIKFYSSSIDNLELESIKRVLSSGYLSQGPEQERFEEKFADIVGAKKAIAVSNGTSALHIALRAYNIGKGDEVITTSFTFAATVTAILSVGAKPVLADISLLDYNIDPEKIENLITKKTKAILCVNLFGMPVNLNKIAQLANSNGIVLIQDASQSVGATYMDSPIGQHSTCTFSLYATKNITTGEGGVITTNDLSIDKSCRKIRNHGFNIAGKVETISSNYRLSEIQAALGNAQLEKLDYIKSRREENAKFYFENIKRYVLPTKFYDRNSAWHQFAIRCEGTLDRNNIKRKLQEDNIETRIYYQYPAHTHPAIISKVKMPFELTKTNYAADNVLCLPMHANLAQDELLCICEKLNTLSNV